MMSLKGSITKIKHFAKKLLKHQSLSDDPMNFTHEFEKVSFSQCGEDLIVDYIFNLRGVTQPSYIDIGANHPFYLSNTALFYKKGCRGINIEANPNLMENFLRFRGQDLNLNYGVGIVDEEILDFFILNDPTLSTFSKSEAKSLEKTGKYSIVETKEIKTYTLSSLLTRYCKSGLPDFLSIDVEGLDFDILKTIDFSLFKPKVICIESHDYSVIGAGKRREELINYIIDNNYHEYADTGLNSIFVYYDFWFI